MSSVQRMRWTLVWMSGIAGIICFVYGQFLPGAILLGGVAAHTAHWQLHKQGVM